MIGFGSSPLELLATDAMLRGEIYCTYYDYSAAYIDGTATDLAASGTTTVQIQINSDSDFLVQEINLTVVQGAANTIQNPDMLLLLTRSGSGRQLMNQAQHVRNICGGYTGGSAVGVANGSGYPGRLPFPFLLQANSTLTCQLQDLSGVATIRADLAFRGFQIFYTGSVGRKTIFHAL